MVQRKGVAQLHEIVENAMAISDELQKLSFQPGGGTQKKLQFLQDQYMQSHKLMVGEIKKANLKPIESASEKDPESDKLLARRDSLRQVSSCLGLCLRLTVRAGSLRTQRSNEKID
jgi:hypothetical protein